VGDFSVVFVVLALIGGCTCGAKTEQAFYEKAAVEAGVAEYTIDPKTGETSFVYKTCK